MMIMTILKQGKNDFPYELSCSLWNCSIEVFVEENKPLDTEKYDFEKRDKSNWYVSILILS